MKLAAYCLMLGTILAMLVITQNSRLVAAPGQEIILGSDEHIASGELVVDRQRAFTIKVDPSIGSTAYWQSAVADLDGDGIDDLIIGLPFASPHGLDEAGLVAVIYGRESGFGQTVELAALDGDRGFLVAGSQAGERLGWSLAEPGDFSGNGMDHLAIGAPGRSSRHATGTGAVFVLTDTTSYPAMVSSNDLHRYGGWRVNAPAAAGSFGFSVAGIGDFNGDGLADLAVGDPDAAPDGMPGAGTVSVIHWAPRSHATPAIRNYRFGLQVNGARPEQRFGLSIAGVGELVGSDTSGLLIGAPGANLTATEPRAGAAYWIAGGTFAGTRPVAIDMLLGSAAMELTAGTANDHFGMTLAVTADRQLLIGAPGHDHDAGAVYRVDSVDRILSEWIGRGPVKAPFMTRIAGQSAGSRFGAGLASLGDLTGDGHADLAMLDSHASGQTGWFRLHRVAASGSGVLEQQATALRPELLKVRFDGRGLTTGYGTDGWVLASAGSLDGRDQRRWVVAGNHHDLDGDRTGKLHVFPAQVRSEHAPVINDGAGIPNQVADVDSVSTVEFTIGPDPDDYLCSADSALVDGGDATLILTCGGVGADRTLEIVSDVNDLGGLHKIDVTVTDTASGESTTETFLLGLREVNSPSPSRMPNRLTYDDRTVTSDFSMDFSLFLEGTIFVENEATNEFDFHLELPADRIFEDTANEFTVLVDPPADDMGPGRYIVSILAGGFEGEEAYTGFLLEVFGAADAFVNGGEGFQSPKQVMETQTLLVEFEIGDLVYPPDELDVLVFSDDVEAIPNEDLTPICIEENCQFEVTPPLSSADSSPIGIRVYVCQGVCDVKALPDSVWPFDLEIEPRPPPVINDGLPIEDQTVVAGEMLIVTFGISDDVDPIDLISVGATSSDQDQVPDDALSFSEPCEDENGGDGVCELVIDATELAPGLADITITAMNDVGLSSTTTFLLEILQAAELPVINDGGAIANQIIHEGQSRVLSISVTEEVDTGSLVVAANSSNENVIPNANLTLSSEGGDDFELLIQTNAGAIGTAEIVVSAENLLGVVTSAFDVQVIERPPPRVNGSSGIANQEMTAGSVGEISFVVDDLFDLPADISTTVQSRTTSVLPSNALSLTGTGSQRLLSIDVPADASGTATILLTAVNSVFRFRDVLFDVVITEGRLAPVINQGEPLGDRVMSVGGALEFQFDVTDPLDAPELIVVGARSLSQSVVPDSALSLQSDGAVRVLSIDGDQVAAGTARIVVEATNTAGLMASSAFDLLVLDRLAELELELGRIEAPEGPDVYVELRVDNVSDIGAEGIELTAQVDDEGFEVVAGYSLAPVCLLEGDEVSCDADLIAPWDCRVEEQVLHCQLDALPPEARASAVLHLSGSGQASLSSSVMADNAMSVDQTGEIEN